MFNNSINANQTGLQKTDASGVWTATTVTNHSLLVGGASNALTSVAPSATSGVPVISQGSGVDPTFGTAVVAGGGTGNTSTTAFGLIAAGTTSTGAYQVIAPNATSGKILQSAGAAALPVYSTATYPGTAGTTGNLLISNGTNFLSTAPTFFSQVVLRTFTSSGTYTPTSGMKYCIINATGGGGGGGGSNTTAALQVSVGGGGGGGGSATTYSTAATIGVSQTVTVGAAGAGGPIGAFGAAGGASSVGSLCAANGGSGGASSGVSTATLFLQAGGTGGSATVGNFGFSGGQGGYGIANGNSGTSICVGGAGGLSSYGGGSYVLGSGSGAGNTGANFGVGGGGAVTAPGNTGQVGGAGNAGIVTIVEFI